MSNKRYRRKPDENRQTPDEARRARERIRETLTDINAAFSNGNFTTEHFKQVHEASRDVLRNSLEREAAEKREAQADTHGVDQAANEAQERFKQRMAEAPEPKPERLSDADVIEILENTFLKLNHISNNATYSMDAVNPAHVDRIYARDMAERASKPERPARAHPLAALSMLVTRCSRLMIQIIAITRPHLFKAGKAAVANVEKVAAAGEKIVGSVSDLAAMMKAKPAAS